ncbi:universal stress protein [Halobellus sp. EA9]|uniref:universal stress protein n=1 Tax=Halobellus sp. EA9 TaxID=3421647 RepID=UPI003EBEA06E
MAIETILLAVGPDERERIDRLVEAAIDVAGPTGARVILGHVFTDEEFERAVGNLDRDVEVGEISADDVAGRFVNVRDAADQLEAAGVDYEIRGAIGEHGRAIVELADGVAADRILVGGRQRSPAGKAVFGSTAQEVLLNAPCPVTLVRSDTR